MLGKYFRDPVDKEDLAEVHKRISNISCPQEAYEFAKSIDGWIVDEIPKFAHEHSALNENWDSICQRTRQTKKCILIVKKIILDNLSGFTTIRAISEILTRCGWCVRGHDDFKKCKDCSFAIQAVDKKDYCDYCEVDHIENLKLKF